jgi:fatty acid desaturase
VRPRRYWLTLLPLATDINYSDFVAHRPLAMTRDRLLSNLWAIPYHGAYVWYAWTHFGALFTVLAYLVVLPHIGFPVDRLRQFTEHNLMPLENRNGARSFGLGFWGLLVGGGPWGQPCHLEHHLVPSIPWYQQAILHRYVVSVLTPRQRRQFLLTPVVGFPRLWWRTIRQLDRFAASREALKI